MTEQARNYEAHVRSCCTCRYAGGVLADATPCPAGAQLAERAAAEDRRDQARRRWARAVAAGGEAWAMLRSLAGLAERAAENGESRVVTYASRDAEALTAAVRAREIAP